MKITYTGRQVELAPAQLKKLEARFGKIGKLLDGRRESEAHVILSLERHLQCAEVTVNYYNHQLVGVGSSTDLFTAIHSAAEKLEKQAVKARTKWRDTKRTPKSKEAALPEPPAAKAKKLSSVAKKQKPVAVEEGEEETSAETKIFRVDHHEKRKPMTLEEAMLVMDKNRDYLVYKDADTDRTSVLVRRRDGNFDLVEG
jgi:putative sigma-54 modulation protein